MREGATHATGRTPFSPSGAIRALWEGKWEVALPVVVLVALRAGQVVAQVAAVVHRHPDKPTELYIDEVGVTPALQRQGIASAMLERMLALGKALGCAEAWVGTETDNGPARGLYESRGAAAEPFVLYLFKL